MKEDNTKLTNLDVYMVIGIIIIITGGVIYFSLPTQMLNVEEDKYCIQWQTPSGWIIHRNNLLNDIYDWKDSKFKFVYIIDEQQTLHFYEAGDWDSITDALHDAYKITPDTEYVGSYNCTKYVELLR